MLEDDSSKFECLRGMLRMTLISSRWVETTLENAPLKIIDGDRGTNYPKQTDFSESGYCLFLNTGNVTKSGFNFSDCSFISQEKDVALRKGRIQRNDVLLTTRGTVGNTAWVDETVPYSVMRINSGMVILRPDIEKLIPEYIYFFLRSPKFKAQVSALRSGTAQPQLPIQVLKSVKIPIPSITEQRRIAAILDRADAVRRKRQEAIALTEELLRSSFLEMFGNPAELINPNTVSLRDGWIKCKLGDQLTLQRGFDITKEQCQEGVYPVVSSGGVSCYHSQYKALGPGVLLGRKGSVGRVHYVEENYWPHAQLFGLKNFKKIILFLFTTSLNGFLFLSLRRAHQIQL